MITAAEPVCERLHAHLQLINIIYALSRDGVAHTRPLSSQQSRPRHDVSLYISCSLCEILLHNEV